MAKHERRNCVLYVTATCNLKCKYCYIDKSPVLVKIDKVIEESYQSDYYFNFMQEMFEQSNLERIEFWGGEPTYGLARAFPTLSKAIYYFPNLTQFYLSTNLTTDTCVADLINFYTFLSENFPEKNFYIGTQLSLDGPEHINDFNRGAGTTKLFMNNFSKLLAALSEFFINHHNLHIDIHFKPTLDIDSIAQLQTKQAVIDYVRFFDAFHTIGEKYLGHVPPEEFEFALVIPNTATPAPHTSEGGKLYANYCRCINSITPEEINKYFRFHRVIMPYCINAEFSQRELCNGCGTCGTGSVTVGLLPGKMLSTCHNGFVELISDYKLHVPDSPDLQIDATMFKYNNATENSMIKTMEQYASYEKQMTAYHPNAIFQTVEMASIIRQMAKAGQVDKKYEDLGEAVEAAHFIQNVASSCMRDNIGVTGSKYLFQLGFMRLFLNGAKEEIQKYARDLQAREQLVI